MVELDEDEVAAVMRMRRERETPKPKPKTDARGVPICTYCGCPVTSAECQRSHP